MNTTNKEELSLALTPEGKAAREHGLRKLQNVLLAKQDWKSAEERASDFEGFNEMAKHLREADQSIADLQPVADKDDGCVTFHAPYPHVLEVVQRPLDEAGVYYLFRQTEKEDYVVVYLQQQELFQTALVHDLADKYKKPDGWENVLETCDTWDRFAFRAAGYWILVADMDTRGCVQQFDDTPEGYAQARRWAVRMDDNDITSTQSVEEIEQEWRDTLDDLEEELRNG